MTLPDLGVNLAETFRFGGRLDDAAKKHVRREVHRFQFVLGFDGGVFMLEVNDAHNIRVPCVYVPAEDTLYRFPLISVLASPNKAGTGTLDGVVGSYSAGVIGTIGDASNVNQALATVTPQQRNVDRMKALDNPAVVFSKVLIPH